MQMPRIEYSADADAAYVYFREGVSVAHTKNLDGVRLVDLDVNGEVIGVELLDVSEGVNLDGLPYPDIITVLLEQQQVRVFA